MARPPLALGRHGTVHEARGRPRDHPVIGSAGRDGRRPPDGRRLSDAPFGRSGVRHALSKPLM